MTKIPRGQTPERRAYMKAYNDSHPRRKRDPEYKAMHDRKYREKNSEALKQKKREYYWKNRESALAKVKRYAEKNRERILQYQADYYAQNSEKVKATVSRYRAANPEKKWHLENRRRVRKTNNGGSHTLEERQEKFERFGNVCFYCKKSKKLTIDHDVPISRGGTDDISNILPCCRSCNSKKNAKTADEFIQLMTKDTR